MRRWFFRAAVLLALLPAPAVLAQDWARAPDSEELRRAADNGDPAAQNRLATLRLFVARDTVEAAEWFRRAAEGGNPEAQSMYGLFLAEGHRVPRDVSKAVMWWRRAAGDGSSSAQIWLAKLLLHGDGVPADTAEARRWLNQAAAGGSMMFASEATDLLRSLARVTTIYLERVQLGGILAPALELSLLVPPDIPRSMIQVSVRAGGTQRTCGFEEFSAFAERIRYARYDDTVARAQSSATAEPMEFMLACGGIRYVIRGGTEYLVLPSGGGRGLVEQRIPTDGGKVPGFCQIQSADYIGRVATSQGVQAAQSTRAQLSCPGS